MTTLPNRPFDYALARLDDGSSALDAVHKRREDFATQIMSHLAASDEFSEMMRRNIAPFRRLMTYYECAMMEMETKFRVLDAEFGLQHDRNPIESIKTRLKSTDSLAKKLTRKGFPITVESVEKNIFDVAGVRVICSFPDDIYRLAELLTKQDDIIIVREKDYIKNPKPNGYRSLHFILSVPIFLSNEKKYMKAEVQFRTIAMDFWASLEHKLKYKKNVNDTNEIVRQLKECADSIEKLDQQMQQIRNKIDHSKE